MTDRGTKQIEDWFENAIVVAREGSGLLQHGFDLSEPCQIEVFWMNHPLEGQVFVITHDRDRPDEQIIINGPFGGSSFVEKVGEIVQADRWVEPLPPPRNKKPGRGPPTKADRFASTITRFVERMEQSIFTNIPSKVYLLGGQRLWDQTFSHIFLGNVGEYELDEIIKISTESDTDENSKENESEQSNGDQESDDESERIVAGGGYIYEPVWIEKAPKSTFSEKVWGNKPRNYEKVYTSEICDFDFHAYRDGLLLVSSEDGEEVQQVLNTLFGVGLFHRYRMWRALLRNEIYSAILENGEISRAGWEGSTPTGRNELVNPEDRPSDYDRSLLPIEGLQRFIEIVNVVYPIHNVRNRIILHLQSHSHLLDDEFQASFVLNWTCIEQLVDDLLKERVDDAYDLDWEDKGLEFAEFADLIEPSEYELLDKHRNNRNNIIHDMESVSVKEAEELDLLVSKLLTRNVNTYLQSQNVSPINFQPVPIKFENRKPEIRRDFINL
jgi:hypothetical protein